MKQINETIFSMNKISLERLSTKEWLPEYYELTKIALSARKFAYVPYSKFTVGAALVGNDDTIYTGCNVENAAYGVANCAERTALFKAISMGVRNFTMIVIVGKPEDKTGSYITPPCGICRQALREFCNPDEFYVLMPEVSASGKVTNFYINTLTELLPCNFGPENLLQQNS